MRALPEDFEAADLIGSLADDWDFEVETAEYAPVGGGSYHWVVSDSAGQRRFVTVDDLDRKPWFGGDRESVFDGLEGAFDTALALREAGLDFVLAPIPTSGGETVRRAAPRYTVALFPFVDGHAGTFGEYEPAERAAIVAMLAELHAARPPASTRKIDLELPGRSELEEALRALEDPWPGGPLSEAARELLARNASYVAELLNLFDRLSEEVASGTNWVVTHGEPHAGNVMTTGDGYVLIDWDTVAIAPPERDLWMLPDEATDPNRVHFFRLTWTLADIAAFTSALRSSHRKNADTVKAYDALTYYLVTAPDR